MTEERQRTLYGRRRGKKLRAGQEALLDTLLPKLLVAVPPEPRKIDPAALFGGIVVCRRMASGSRSASAPASIWCGRPSSIRMSG